MKKYILLFSLIAFTAGISMAQSKDASTTSSSDMPTYAHGTDSDMMAFIMKNLNIDCDDATEVTSGKIFIAFTVNAEGKVQDANVKKGIHSCIDQAAIDVVKKLEFNPATKDGKAVSVEMALPIQIELE